MDYNTKTLMKDDVLKTLKFISSDIIQFKIVRVALWITFLVHLAATLLTLYFLIYVLDPKDSARYTYVAIVAGTVFPIMSIFVALFDNGILGVADEEFPLWSINTVSEKIKSKIEMEINVITAIAVIGFVFSLAASLVFAQYMESDYRMFFMIRFARDYCPALEYVYKSTYFFISYIYIVIILQNIYCKQQLKYQLIILNEYLANISNCTGNVDEDKLFYDRNYQGEIQKRMIFCIKRYGEYVKIISKIQKKMSKLLLPFSAGGCLLVISVGLLVLYGCHMLEYYPRGLVVCPNLCLLFCAGLWSGQSFETQTKTMITAMNQVRWYNFNKDNKILFLILSENLLKVPKIQFSENICVNYELGLSIIRKIYCVISVTANMDIKLMQ